MTGRHTLALALILILLTALYFGVQQWKQHRGSQEQERKKMVRLDPAEIHEVAITQLDAPEVRAARDAAGQPWRMIRPDATIPPHQPMWNRIVEKYAGLTFERILKNPSEDTAAYGLNPPVLRVEFTAENGKKDVILFGDLEPTERFRYACRPDDKTIFLIGRDLYYELNRSLDDLRHKFIADNRNAAIRMIEFALIWREGDAPPDAAVSMRPGEESVVVRAERDDENSPWKLVSPIEAPADQEALDALAEYLQFGVVAKFFDHPEHYADFGLDPPRARLTFADVVKGNAQTLLIGQLENSDGSGGLFIRRAGQTAVELVDPRLLELIPQRPTQWRETRLITRRVCELSAVVCARAEDSFTLRREQDGAWRLVDPVFDDVSDQVISGYLAVLKETRGEVVDRSAVAAGQNDPQVRFLFTYADGAEAECRLWPDPEQANAWLATQDTGGVIRLMGVAADALLVPPSSFRSRQLMRFEVSQANRLEFSLNGQQYVLGIREGRWRVIEPAGWSIQNQSDAKSILEALSKLQADVVMSRPAVPEVSGLDIPVFTAVVQCVDPVTGAESRHGPLRIGHPVADDPQRRYADVAGRVGQFLVAQEVVETVRTAALGLRPPSEGQGNNAEKGKISAKGAG